MKSVLVFAALIASFICMSQNKKADKLYDKGVEAYNSENYRAADSLFGLSAEIQPNRDVYYNLAIVKTSLVTSANRVGILNWLAIWETIKHLNYSKNTAL